MKKTLTLLILIISLIVFAGCTGTENGVSEQDEKFAEGDTARIGHTVKEGDLQITLHGARLDEACEFADKCLAIEVELLNTGDKSVIISSLHMFELYSQDSYSIEFELMDDSRGNLDGELGAGKKMRGEIVCYISADDTQWELIFKPNVLGFEKAIFVIDINDVN